MSLLILTIKLRLISLFKTKMKNSRFISYVLRAMYLLKD